MNNTREDLTGYVGADALAMVQEGVCGIHGTEAQDGDTGSEGKGCETRPQTEAGPGKEFKLYSKYHGRQGRLSNTATIKSQMH